jgi:hypothetical protein
MLAFALLLLTAGSLTFTAPADWKSTPPASRMRVAEFVVPPADGDRESTTVIVYYFGGMGGSADANIERWIGQMQQPDGKPSKDVAIRSDKTINGLKISMIDVAGTFVAEVRPGSAERHNKPGFRMRAAVVETPGGPYFVKLTGPAKTVERASAAFDQFLGSLRYTP